MTDQQYMKQQTEDHGSVTSCVIGFVLSLFFTFAAYFAVVNHTFELGILVTVLLVLALLQLIVQLFAFLHLGQEKKPRWNMVFFLLTVVTILTVVIGALWIMDHLNKNMMPGQVQDFIIQDEGLKSPAYP